VTEYQVPRGTRDLLPETMAKYALVERKLGEAARLFGFRDIRTPMFEATELFTARSGEGIIEEMYVFEDKGGRSMTLRPEITASVVRMYINEMTKSPKPIKVSYLGSCFRYEKPQTGRFREFFQFGAEILGAPALESDAEIIALASNALSSLGISDLVIRIGQIGIMRQMLQSTRIPKEGWPAILHSIDKKEFGQMEATFEDYGDSSSSDRFSALAELKGGREVLAEAREIAGETDALVYLSSLFDRLEKMGVKGLTVDLGVVRGLDYYTGMVFEVDSPSLGAEKQVCGGGAYSLAEVFGGEPIPSTGFAMGVDRLVLALERQGYEFDLSGVWAYVIPLGEKAVSPALSLVAEMRKAGMSADIEIMGRNLSKALAYADVCKARYAIILGERDLAAGNATIRDLKTGDQQPTKLTDIIKVFKAFRQHVKE